MKERERETEGTWRHRQTRKFHRDVEERAKSTSLKISLFCASQAKQNSVSLKATLYELFARWTAGFYWTSFRSRNQHCLGSVLTNNLGLVPSNLAFGRRALRLGVVRERNFGTAAFPVSRSTHRVVCMSEELLKYMKQEQKRFFRSDLPLMGDKSGKPPKGPCGKEPPCSSTPTGPSPSCSSPSPFAPGPQKKGQSSSRGPCRQPYERQKPCPPPEKCIPPAPPCCRRRPLNPKCPDQPRPPCPPPCPTPCPTPKPPEKPPPPKICYRKCPPPPKLPKLPKCPKIPSPPKPPPLPKLPRLPKCPPPCPPPVPPPPPTCPRMPKCPECPPQRECPPPPPCEPCPCPPPCPPPCCPPPPPCPPCPPPIPCPKPLPCPPPPAPRVCPPCPPCPEYPKPKPCPPPPPCCPCPCPKPPPPCPCPKPCPPCKQPEPECPKDTPSCPKGNPGGMFGKKDKRKMSTFSRSFVDVHKVHIRGLHLSLISLGKRGRNRDGSGKSASGCKSMDQICEEKGKGNSCGRTCKDKKESSCQRGRAKCAGRTNRSDKKKSRKKKAEKKMDNDEVKCTDSCLPRGKCEQPVTVAPPRMEYGKVACPSPKFVSPPPCPAVQSQIGEDGPHVEVRPASKKKHVCPPLPLPKPPTKPVLLCPCPPPPKVHPGPCPCYEMSVETKTHPVMPPCPVKEKPPCTKKVYYCPQEKKVCERREKSCKHRENRQKSDS